MPGRRASYLPAIDGLRALAVIAVLVYHLDAARLPGGFLGVDLFFAISGYLITAGLLREWGETGRIEVTDFWKRRARRLLPAAFAMIIAVLAVCAIWIPGALADTRGAALAATAYITNWYLIFRHQSYFETVGTPPMLQHLWSLAVEEQFYLVWPLALLVALRWVRRSVVAVGVTGVAIALTMLTALLSAHGVDADRLYYGTDTRAAELLAGAALAFVWAPSADLVSRRRLAVPLELLGGLALVALVAAFRWFDASQAALYAGGLTFVSIASCLAIAVSARPTLLGRALGIAPLRWIGMRSYSIYLWHWPILVLGASHSGLPIGSPQLVALEVALTAVAAELSFRCLEAPLRQGALERIVEEFRRLPESSAWRSRTLIGVAAGSATAMLLLLEAATFAQPQPVPEYLATASIHLTTVQPAVVATPAGSPTSESGKAADAPAADVTPAPPDDQVSPASSVVVTSSDTSASVPAATDTSTWQSHALVTAIGDSVMLGAANELARQLGSVNIDAASGRSSIGVLQVLQAREDTGELESSTVLIQVGDNGPLSADELDRILQGTGTARRVVLVNVRVPRPWESANNALLAAAVSRHPNTVLVDWYGASEGHPEFFWDGMHLKPEGASLYAQLISSALAR